MSVKSIISGLSAIQSLDIKEIDETIDWLQEALAAYKTLRAVREVMDRKPVSIDVPKWKSAVDVDKEERMQRTPDVKTRVIQAFEKHGQPLTAAQLVYHTGLEKNKVKACLTNHRNKPFVRYADGGWGMNQVPKPVVLPMPSNEGAGFDPDVGCELDEDGYKVR
jgi:hypothetical protein